MSFQKIHDQLVMSDWLELLEGEISQDGQVPDHICASWGTAQHPRAPHPIPAMLGTTKWAVPDAGSSRCPPWGSKAGFPRSAALLVCLQDGNPSYCNEVRRFFPAQLHLELIPPIS